MGYTAVLHTSLILEAVDGGRYASNAVDESVTRKRVNRHDGCIAQQSAEVYNVAHFLASSRYDTHRRRLLVNHANGCLVGNHARYCSGGSVARDGYHVETHGAYTGHGFELLYGKGASLHSVYHALVFTHGDKRATQAADIRRR